MALGLGKFKEMAQMGGKKKITRSSWLGVGRYQKTPIAEVPTPDLINLAGGKKLGWRRSQAAMAEVRRRMALDVGEDTPKGCRNDQLRFGPFRGRKLVDVPGNYLRRAIDLGFLTGAQKVAAMEILGIPVSEPKQISTGPIGKKVTPGIDCPFDCPEDEDELDFIRRVREY